MIDVQQGNDPADGWRLREFGRSSIAPCISPVSSHSRLVGQRQPAKHLAQEYGSCGFEHCVMLVALGCLLSEWH